MKKVVVLLSGGLDSTTLLHYVAKREARPVIHVLSFDYGQKHSRELDMARWQARTAGTSEHQLLDVSSFRDLVAGGSALTDKAIDIPSLSELTDADRRQPPTYVPNRNAILLSLGAAYAEARGIVNVLYGAHAQDRYGYWDCTAEFVDRMNAAFSLNRRSPVAVDAPFIHKTKAEILEIGLRLGVDYAHTWSCYRGKGNPCGECPTCEERAAAFSEVGTADPLLER